MVDVDGDGLPDQVRRTADGAEVRVEAELTSLGRQSLALLNANVALLSNENTSHAPILGVVDLDGDGTGEIFVTIDYGASTTFFTIVRLVDSKLAQMALNGEPVSFALFGSVAHQSAVGCDSGQLITAGWSTNDQFQTFDAERNVFRLRGAQLVLAQRTTHTFEADDMGVPVGLETEGYDLHCPPID
jgi:hypothetical protein